MGQASRIVVVGRAWAGFDPVTEEAGAVQYIKGSHKWGKFFAPATFGSGSHFADIYREAGLEVSDTPRGPRPA